MTETEQLTSLSRLEKRFLSRRICWLCEQQLDLPRCGSMYGDTRQDCTKDIRVERRKECLKTYKPRDTHKAEANSQTVFYCECEAPPKHRNYPINSR